MNDINNVDDEQENYIPENVTDIKTLDRLNDASVKYPIWNPKTEGEICGGSIEHIEFMQHLNDNAGAYLVRIVDKKGNKFVVFPNVVMQKKLLQLTPDNKMESLIGKSVIMRYEGKVKPQDARKKEYSTFTVIEDN